MAFAFANQHPCSLQCSVDWLRKTFVASLLNDYLPVVKQTAQGHNTLMSYLAKESDQVTATASMRSGMVPRRKQSYTEMTMMELEEVEGHSQPDDAQHLLESTPPPSPKSPKSRTAVEDFDAHFALNVKRNSSHSPIAKETTTEGDLLVIRYLLTLWQQEVSADEQTAKPETLRRVMTRFNIYMTTPDVANIMCTFLRDKGFDTLEDTGQVRMIFSLFMELLLDIEKYEIGGVKPPWYAAPFSKAVPWSRRLDVTMQICFPVCIALHALISFALLGTYPENPDIGLVADMHNIVVWQ